MCSPFVRFACFFLAAVPAVSACATPTPVTYDVVIRHGQIVDGTGKAPFTADVGIAGDRIVEIGVLSRSTARTVIDAAGLAVAPGFIDVHAHVLSSLQAGNVVESFLRDGVTTAIDGNDGVSGWPIDDTLNSLARTPLSMNVGTFAGLSPVRQGVMGGRPGAATDEERDRMSALVERAMRQGAFGLTSGLEPALYHWPGYFTGADDLVRILRPVARHGGLYAPHLRDEASGLTAAVEETIDVARRAGVRTDLTHAKAVGPGSRERAAAMIRRVEDAQRDGVDLALDQFPYGENGIDLTQFLPAWSFEQGRGRLLEHLRTRETRREIAAFVAEKIREHAGTSEMLYFRRCKADPDAAGRSLAELVRSRGVSNDLITHAEVYLNRIEHDDCLIDVASTDEDAIVAVLQSPLTMVASDGGIGAHPKSYGTRARILGHYVRDRKLLSLQEAVRRMTSLPAERLRLSNRGSLKANSMADIVVFDPDRILSTATRARPTALTEGVRYLFINGRAVIFGEVLTNERSGRVVYGPAWQEPDRSN